MNKKVSVSLIILAALIAAVVVVVMRQETASENHSDAVTSHASNSAEQSAQQSEFDKSHNSLDDPASKWIVSNKLRPLDPLNYAPSDLVRPSVKTHGTQYLRKIAADAAKSMFDAAAAQGIHLSIDSGYRSYQTQVSVYNSEVRAYGQATADRESARPGYSEHQTGLAADFGAANGTCSIADCFANTPEGKWMAANAYKYGYVLRYPEGKEDVTGYRHEAWHFRFVGTELARELHDTGVQTLEEFFDLPPAPDYR